MGLASKAKVAVRLAVERPKGTLDYLASYYSEKQRSSRIMGRPIHMILEPTNVCNLRCPVCETGAGILGRRAGHMSLSDFKTIIDKVKDHLNTLYFYFMGEPFLNPKAYEMIAYAKQYGIFVSTCTNGEFVDPERIVDSGIDEVSWQFGGTTQETHEVYRVDASLEHQIERMKATIAARRRKGVTHPKNIAGLIVMKHNEHQVDDFVRWAKEVGADATDIISPCVRTVEQGHQFLPQDDRYWFYDRAAFVHGQIRPRILPDNFCPILFYSLAVHVNGDVVPCCRDPLGKEIMGNLVRDPLETIWNGDKYQEFRKRILGDQGSIAICSLCSSYGRPELQRPAS